jgi:hypothetical protein
MNFNWYMIPVAALIPMAVGFIWYNPKVFGTAWMKASGMSMEDAKGMNMAKIFGISILLYLMLAVALVPMTIHQMGLTSVFEGDPTLSDPNSESSLYIKHFFEQYGTRFRTFKHGALHGTLGGFFIALPAIAMGALYERKSFTYVAIHAGYMIVSMALMGGVICQFM